MIGLVLPIVIAAAVAAARAAGLRRCAPVNVPMVPKNFRLSVIVLETGLTTAVPEPTPTAEFGGVWCSLGEVAGWD